MNEDTRWQYGEMYTNHRPTHTRVERRMADDMPVRNFMALVTIIVHYANLIDVADYGDYERVAMGGDCKYPHVMVLAKHDFFAADAYVNSDPCPTYFTVKEKTIESYKHDFTLWIGSNLDGAYRVYVAVCDTTAEDVRLGHEYENVLYYSGLMYNHWSEFL